MQQHATSASQLAGDSLELLLLPILRRVSDAGQFEGLFPLVAVASLAAVDFALFVAAPRFLVGKTISWTNLYYFRLGLVDEWGVEVQVGHLEALVCLLLHLV